MRVSHVTECTCGMRAVVALYRDAERDAAEHTQRDLGHEPRITRLMDGHRMPTLAQLVRDKGE